ncbi:MAG: helix-turn-helix transcriptional regulator [Lachnospiraceae bacterium]|nr:helix-turn-helix transcriptional regulator [Lachnospiraceae bacterium]
MDQQKIGRFIAEMRKKQGYTQKEIAEQLGISDKAVSKWETGRSMPDNSIMLPLCELLNINVNELLSGESLSVTEYNRKAEENMMNLMKDSDERKRHARRTRISMVIWVVTLMLLMIIMISNVETSDLANLLYYIDVPGINYVVSIVLISLACSGQINDFFRAFFYVVHGTEDEQKMEMSIKAVRFAERTFLVGGAFVTVFFAIYVLSHVDVIAKTNQVLCANLAVMLTTMVYGCLGALLLAPIRSRLEKMQIM